MKENENRSKISQENEAQLQAMYKKLKALRISKGWTFEELSDKSGIKIEILSAIEGGEDFDVEYFIKLCDIYKIHPCKMFFTIS